MALVGHLGVQLRVGDGERDVAGDDRQDLLLELREGAREVGPERSRARPARRRRTGAAPTPRPCTSGNVRRRGSVEGSPSSRGSPSHDSRRSAIARPETPSPSGIADPDEALVTAAHGRRCGSRRGRLVVAGRGPRGPLPSSTADGLHDRSAGARRGSSEALTVREKAGERPGTSPPARRWPARSRARAMARGHLLGDQDRCVERSLSSSPSTPRVLDVQDAEQFATGHQRRRDLAPDVVLCHPDSPGSSRTSRTSWPSHASASRRPTTPVVPSKVSRTVS